jgi:hypothetical protein
MRNRLREGLKNSDKYAKVSNNILAPLVKSVPVIEMGNTLEAREEQGSKHFS